MEKRTAAILAPLVVLIPVVLLVTLRSCHRTKPRPQAFVIESRKPERAETRPQSLPEPVKPPPEPPAEPERSVWDEAPALPYERMADPDGLKVGTIYTVHSRLILMPCHPDDESGLGLLKAAAKKVVVDTGKPLSVLVLARRNATLARNVWYQIFVEGEIGWTSAINFIGCTLKPPEAKALSVKAVEEPEVEDESEIRVDLCGSTRSSVYHHPWCRHAGRIRYFRRFNSVKEARAAGYRPCRVCRPPAE